ncbi:MAG: bifunctional DNA primase/polymerase, partial [Syntrophales bacterium LBB04]|nr:bifunctional DNA primase/polymerase [Syntrophales bacterium LBB04]
MTLTMLDYALRYRRRGFSVIPCRKDKKPLIKWEAYQTQKPSEDEIKQWWGRWPDANIGIPCGAISEVDVLDCDSQEAYDNLNEFYLNDSFRTPTVKTPKGRHVYFKHRPGLSNAVRAIKGTDIRTQGGYVIAPPSTNGADKSYYWFDGLTPKDCDFAEWPDELFAALQAIGQAQARPLPEKPSLEPPADSGALFSEGRRDNDLFHVANVLTKGGCEEIYKRVVLETLARSCSPPYPSDEIESKIKSAMQRRASKERNLATEVKEWILSTNGEFSISECRRDLAIKGREDCKNLSKI